jgi:hypothetical protein
MFRDAAAASNASLAPSIRRTLRKGIGRPSKGIGTPAVSRTARQKSDLARGGRCGKLDAEGDEARLNRRASG